MYKCEIILDSLSPQKNRLTTFKLTYPRIIHAEMCRHRIVGRNTASSRAIPFKKMLKDVIENPFIPIAWQKDHKGMQGTEYLDPTVKYKVYDFIDVFAGMTSKLGNSKDKKDFNKADDLFYSIMGNYKTYDLTLPEWWLLARDKVVEAAIILNTFGVTKQLCNRLLEPFVWTTELATATELENFFKLRCPKYWLGNIMSGSFKSKKDTIADLDSFGFAPVNKPFDTWTEEDWLKHNSSQAEIHIQKIAEMVWDAYNESVPKELQPGEWHIPYGDKIEESKLSLLHYGNIESTTNVEALYNDSKIKIATARCARLSYETLGTEPKIDYKADIKLHDILLSSQHMSPFEHCARAMNDEEYHSFFRGELPAIETSDDYLVEAYMDERDGIGWCRNYKGFIQYRHLLENN